MNVASQIGAESQRKFMLKEADHRVCVCTGHSQNEPPSQAAEEALAVCGHEIANDPAIQARHKHTEVRPCDKEKCMQDKQESLLAGFAVRQRAQLAPTNSPRERDAEDSRKHLPETLVDSKLLASLQRREELAVLGVEGGGGRSHADLGDDAAVGDE